MKKIFKILLLILIPTLLIGSFFIFHVFFYDPFIKFAPKNTFFYTYANLSKFNIFTKEFNNIISERDDIKKYIENNIDKNNLYKISNYYNHKIAFFLSNENDNINLYIVFKKNKNVKKDNINLEVNNFENIINKYFDSKNKIKLSGEFIGEYFFITNNLNSLNNIQKNSYIFYKEYLYLIFKNKEFDNFLSKDLMNGYININPIKKILDENNINIFNKDYSLFSINYINKKIELKINNIRNIKSEANNFYIYNLFKPNIIIDNFGINNFYKKIKTILEKEESVKNEISFFEKFLNYENINTEEFENIFNNESKIFLTFNHKTDLNNINNFLIITKLNNFLDYYNEIKNLEKIFLREAGKNNLIETEENILEEITIKEKSINTKNLKFEEMDIYNNGIKQNLKFLKLKDYAIYYSFINDGGYFVVSNSLNMINNLYYNEPNKDILEINNLESDIIFRNEKNNLIIKF